MPRRARVTGRETVADAKYQSATVTRFINKMMRGGKKSLAEDIVYSAMELVEQQESKAAVGVLEQALRNAAPVLEVKPRRVGGATYQVPVEIKPDRSMTLAMRWVIRAARERPGKSMVEKLAAELSGAAKGEGAAVKRREETHKMAEANRAFAHFRW
ncbi:MAG: 30S ribosomal protein S7 [Chloroflexota bacterium]